MLLATLLLLAAAPAHATDMIEVGDPSQKTAVVVMPDAARSILDRMKSNPPGQDDWFAVNLEAGTFTGLRAEAFPWSDEHMKVGVEAMAGEQNGSFAAGAGVRVQFRVASGCRQAIYVSPGVDLYLSPESIPELDKYYSVEYVATDVDVSWLYRFSHCCTTFEAGLKLGGEFEATPYDTGFAPEIGVFTGLRF
jgi:hypothetical protein